MSSSKSSRKRPAKVSSDNAVISFDLLSNLTYMAALATGGSDRDTILEWSIKQDFKTGTFFRRVYLLSKRLGFEYTRAFRMVAAKAGASSVKNLLLRFAGAISSGVSEADFLVEEARVERDLYINAYHRSLETLAKWGDAYAALLVSVSLVVVVAMMSTMLSNMGAAFVIMLTSTMVMVSAFGVYIIYRTAPYEVKTYQNRRGPVERYWAKRLFYALVPASILIGIYLGYNYGFHYFLFSLGLALFPSGVMAWLDNGRVNQRDQEAATFVRSLGNVSASLGNTLGAALIKIDRRYLGGLEPSIRRLQIRLSRGISTHKCWDSFRDEVGSELMNRTTRMFVDGVSLGGPPEKVGAIAAEYSMDSATMRARRMVSATPFAFLVIPLHFAMTGLMTFVLEIIRSFNIRIEAASADLAAQSGGDGMGLLPDLPIFQSQDMALMSNITLVALLSMTISNALAPKFALGGHSLIIGVFGSITCLMTAFNMAVIPQIAARIML